MDLYTKSRHRIQNIVRRLLSIQNLGLGDLDSTPILVRYLGYSVGNYGEMVEFGFNLISVVY